MPAPDEVGEPVGDPEKFEMSSSGDGTFTVSNCDEADLCGALSTNGTTGEGWEGVTGKGGGSLTSDESRSSVRPGGREGTGGGGEVGCSNDCFGISAGSGRGAGVTGRRPSATRSKSTA